MMSIRVGDIINRQNKLWRPSSSGLRFYFLGQRTERIGVTKLNLALPSHLNVSLSNHCLSLRVNVSYENTHSLE